MILKALDKNPSVESIKYKITANKSNIDLSKQFSDPVLSYTQNTIDSDQAMSQKTVSLQQKLPYFGKRDNLKNVALAQEAVLFQSLEQAKVYLVKDIKKQAYTIWELDEQYKIINEYELLTKQNIELFESYTSTSGNQHMGIMSAELTLSDLKIQKINLKAKLNEAYARLSYLASFEVKDLEIKLEIKHLDTMQDLQESLKNNYTLAIKEKEIQKTKAITKVQELDNYPDINLLTAYSYRENFDNYFTFGVGVTLPIYSTQDYKEEQSRQQTLEAESLKSDAQKSINSEFQTAYIKMKAAYEIYNVVNGEAMPQIQHMFELTSSSIATGGDLFRYIDILVQKLKLEQRSINAVSSYYKEKAQISALGGAKQ